MNLRKPNNKWKAIFLEREIMKSEAVAGGYTNKLRNLYANDPIKFINH